MTMRLPTTFLSSKVARRIFLLFVSCALLPITVLAVVSFFQVSKQLRSESEKQLAQATKTQAMVIFERLSILDAEMEVLSLQSRDRKSLVLGNALEGHFLNMTVLNNEGESVAVWRGPTTLPGIAPKERLHLLSGKALLSIGPCSNQFGKCVTMVRTIDLGQSATGTLLGEINPEYLWDTPKLPPGLGFCAVSSGSILFCSDPEMGLSGSGLPGQIRGASGLFQWKYRQTLYDAAYWTLLLKPSFLVNPWTIALSQKHSDVLAPMRHFRTTFPFVILLALWSVMLFSSIQIRRTLVPLEKLQEGTRQIGATHFESRVDVQSGDEFEALAASFNSMADRLGSQFEALKTINDIDQAIFASLDREGIVDAVLDRMPYLLPCDCFAVTLFRDVQSSGWVRLRNTQNGKPGTLTLNTSITAADLQSLHDNPEVCAISEVQRVPAFLLPLREAGMASFLILPILVDGTVFAALVCADGNTLRIAADNVHHARQVADQLAVAFSNVQMIEALEQLHWGSLTALARAIDAKSAWTSGHSERVTNLALKIGQAMKLPAKELKIMHRGGLLHDIGKIGTPPNILDKPGKLEPEEMQVMRDHVQIGVRILEPIPGFQEAMPIVAQHHEWFDGSGYPAGLAGENISLHARIFAVADCFDALTSDRPYRKGLPKQQVAEMLREKSGTQFDPMVIEVFTRLCGEEESSTVDQLARRAAAGQLA